MLLQREISEMDLDVITLEWTESLHKLSDQDFVAALRRHRRQSRYWPTEFDILEAHETEKNANPVPMLPEAASSPEELRKGRISGLMFVEARENRAAEAYFDRSKPWRMREEIARGILGDRFPDGPGQ